MSKLRISILLSLVLSILCIGWAGKQLNSQILTNKEPKRSEARRSQSKPSVTYLNQLLDSATYYARIDADKSIEIAKEVMHYAKSESYTALVLSAYMRVARTYDRIKVLDSSIYYFEKAREMAFVSYDTTNLLSAYSGLGVSHKKRGEILISSIFYQYILDFEDSYADEEVISNAYLQLGHNEKDLGNFNSALNHLLNALTIREDQESTVEIGQTYISIANVYRHMGNYKRALEYTDLGYEIYKSENRPLQRVYNQFGLICLGTEDYDGALKYFKKSYDINLENNNLAAMGRELNNIGVSYRNQGKLQESLNYQLESLKLKKKTEDINYLGSTYNNLGLTYIELKQYHKAKLYLDSSLTINKRLQLKKRIMSSYEGLFKLYQTLKQSDKALEYHILYTEMKDIISSENSQQQIAEINTLHKIEKNESEILLLKQSNEIQEFSISRQKQVRNFFIYITFLIFLIVAFVYNRYLIKKKANELLIGKNILINDQTENLKKANATKDKFFSILAHDLRSPFNNILGYSEKLDQHYEDYSDKERKKMIKSLSESTASTYELVENLLTWSRAQRGYISIEKKPLNLKDLTRVAISPYVGVAEDKDIKIVNIIDENTEFFADEETVRTIIGNIFNNSVKFTKTGGEIGICSHDLGDRIEIEIMDNGIGIKPEKLKKLFELDTSISTKGTLKEEGTGLGLVICKEFAEMNHGQIIVESEVGKGSSFKIQLPYKNIGSFTF